MGVDLIVALKLQPIKLEVASSTRNIFSIIDIFGDVKGSELVQALALQELVHFLVLWLTQHFLVQ